MYNDSLQTTNEEEMLSFKVTRFATNFPLNVDLIMQKAAGDQKYIPKMDFRMYIKESPFSKYSCPGPKEQFNKAHGGVERQSTKNISDFSNNARDATRSSSDKASTGQESFSKPPKKPLETKKSYGSYPKSILKKGIQSKFSQDFEKYYDPSRLEDKRLSTDQAESDTEFLALQITPVKARGGDASHNVPFMFEEEEILDVQPIRLNNQR